MKLSVNILIEKMQKYDFSVYSTDSSEPHLEGIRLFDKELLIDDIDYLYIGYSYNLPKLDDLPGGASILCIGKPSDLVEHSELHVSLIVMNGDYPLGRLFNEISDLFLYFNKWESQLQELIMNNCDLQQFVDISDKVMSWPISIIDRAQRTLATSRFEDSDDIIWQEIRRGFIHTEFLQQDKVKAADVAKYHHPFQGYSNVSNRVILSQAIRVDGHVVGFVAVHHPKPGTEFFSRGVEHMVSLFTKFVAKRMRSNEFYKQSHGLMFEYLLVDLIENNMKNEHIINDRLAFLDWKLDGYKQIIRIEILKDYYQASSLAALRDDVANIIPSGRSIIYDNALVAIISNTADSLLDDNVKAAFISWLEKNNAYCGVSSRYMKLNRTITYYNQAKKAIRFGRIQNPDQQIFNYSDYQMLDIVEMLSERSDLKLLYYSAFEKLLELSRSNEFYFDTLKVFLQTERNVALASKMLFIHRNTLIYRIKRLEEELGCDLDDYKTRMNLLFSFELYNYLKNYQ